MIKHPYCVECSWCREPSGGAGVPVPAPFAHARQAVADAIDQDWTHDLDIGLLLCTSCAELAENLPAQNQDE